MSFKFFFQIYYYTKIPPLVNFLILQFLICWSLFDQHQSNTIQNWPLKLIDHIKNEGRPGLQEGERNGKL